MDMVDDNQPGAIVILNGAPRSGKSSIVRVIQESFDGVWMNLGVDVFMREVAPPSIRPGIGLRPGGERADLEPLIPRLYAAMYEAMAAQSRLGLNVVTDVGHHDHYTKPLGVLRDCAKRLLGLPVLFVGVRCSLEVIMQRRAEGQPGREGAYVKGTADDPFPAPVRRWQDDVHKPGIYDLEVDTTSTSPEHCADTIRKHLEVGIPKPSAFARLASD
jgi:chloramphenicol 3-O phosphotransferase